MPLDGSDGADSVKRGSDPSNIMIGIMGPTGIGKSSFIARLTGGHSVESATIEIGHHNYFDESGRSVTLVDSPGFDDSWEGLTDTDVLRKFAAFLEKVFKQDKKLSGIIYLHRITDRKVEGISRRNLKMFRKLCGEDALENVVVVTTRWDDVPEKDREMMEKWENELMKTSGRFFQPLIAAGGRFLRHDNTGGSARRIVASLLKNHPIPPQTQTEMPEGKTAAGSELAAELKKLVDKHSKEMKDLKEEVVAIAIKGEALKKELEAERSKMQKEVAKWEEQKKVLADDITAAREDAKKKQEEADRKLLQQGNEFHRRVKEMEEKARKEKEEADRKHRDLLRSMRRQVCHWESFSSRLRSALFNPVPIQAGVEKGVSAFVLRCRTEKSNGSVVTDCVLEGQSMSTRANGNNYWDFQVLVGDPSRLIWTPCRGRFDVKSTVQAVPCWDKDVDNVSDIQYIARFINSGLVYVTGVTASANGVSDVDWGTGVVVSSQDYEVLCYKDL